MSRHIPYKQFGYRQGCSYDVSYVIEEVAYRYHVTVELIARRGGRTAGSRVLKAEFSNLAMAQQYISKKA